MIPATERQLKEEIFDLNLQITKAIVNNDITEASNLRLLLNHDIDLLLKKKNEGRRIGG